MYECAILSPNIFTRFTTVGGATIRSPHETNINNNVLEPTSACKQEPTVTDVINILSELKSK